MAKRSQRKGRAGEIELAHTLQTYGYSVKPGPPISFGTTPDLIGLPGIHIECKRVEHLNLDSAMEQAIEDSEKFGDGCPAVFHRKNRKEWMVSMRLTDWMKFYQTWRHE